MVFNNPVLIVDQYRRLGTLATAGIGAGIGAIAGGIAGGLSGKGVWRGALAGAAGGFVAGLTLNPALGAKVSALAAGALAGGAGGLASGVVSEATKPCGNFNWGNVGKSIMIGVVTGGTLGGVVGANASGYGDSFTHVTEGILNANVTFHTSMGYFDSE